MKKKKIYIYIFAQTLPREWCSDLLSCLLLREGMWRKIHQRYYVCKGTASPINAFAQANSLWAFHRNLGSVVEKRPHTRVLHMLLGLPRSGKQSRGHWQTDGCHKRHSGRKLLPPPPVSPDKRTEMAFFHTMPRLSLPPDPTLPWNMEARPTSNVTVQPYFSSRHQHNRGTWPWPRAWTGHF